MTWNGPVDGDWTELDSTKAPWAAGVMTLSHDECVYVLDTTQPIIDTYDPKNNNGEPISDFYVISTYNNLDWSYAINGDTYGQLKNYEAAGFNLGIDENGIIQPEPEQLPEEPTEEPPAEDPQPEEEQPTE
jgi:hypothetical protein